MSAAWFLLGFLLGSIVVWGSARLERVQRARESQGRAREGKRVAVRWHLAEAPGITPRRAYAGDAGLDLFSSEGVTVWPGEYAEVACGFDIELPKGYWGLLHSRSSTMRRGLIVNTSVIDSGYRGPMFVGVRNVSQDAVEVKPSERLGQLIVMPLVPTHVKEVQTLSASERGSSGFGSSGK
jgi:dUTP pyrophosphatase